MSNTVWPNNDGTSTERNSNEFMGIFHLRFHHNLVIVYSWRKRFQLICSVINSCHMSHFSWMFMSATRIIILKFRKEWYIPYIIYVNRRVNISTIRACSPEVQPESLNSMNWYLQFTRTHFNQAFANQILFLLWSGELVPDFVYSFGSILRFSWFHIHFVLKLNVCLSLFFKSDMIQFTTAYTLILK